MVVAKTKGPPPESLCIQMMSGYLVDAAMPDASVTASFVTTPVETGSSYDRQSPAGGDVGNVGGVAGSADVVTIADVVGSATVPEVMV